jgi:hypothetical protein
VKSFENARRGCGAASNNYCEFFATDAGGGTTTNVESYLTSYLLPRYVVSTSIQQ